MGKGRIGAVIALVCGFAAPAPGLAVPVLIDGSRPANVLVVASGHGDAVLKTDGTGDPMILGRIGPDNYRIYFYDCAPETGCKNLTFAASWASNHYTDTSMGDWNRTRRFGTAYLDRHGNPTLEMSLNLQGGITRASLEDSFGWWRALLADFSDFLGFGAETPASAGEPALRPEKVN
jgi:hypothetical protein